jgi:hypothetical protein
VFVPFLLKFSPSTDLSSSEWLLVSVVCSSATTTPFLAMFCLGSFSASEAESSEMSDALLLCLSSHAAFYNKEKNYYFI